MGLNTRLIVTLSALAVLSFAAAGCSPRLEPLVLSPSPTLVPPSPSPLPTEIPPTATPVPPPTPTPSPTPAPTINPTRLSNQIDADQGAIASRSVDPICLQQGDADDDGIPEWVGVYLQPGDPGRLRGFVLDDTGWYDLQPPTEEGGGMGTYPTCGLTIEDLNRDGRTELLIEGRLAGNVDLLHMFVWQGDGYGLLASFQGDVGVDARDTDGDLIPEIIARYHAGTGLAWEAVHTWDGSHYGWTWERYAWLHWDRPHALTSDQPRNAVISYYLALDGRDLPGAYDLLSGEAQGTEPYGGWAVGFSTTLGVEVGSVREIERTADTARVTAQVRAYDNEGGYAVGRMWDVTWNLTLEGNGWRLNDSTADLLDEWEAPYYR